MCVAICPSISSIRLAIDQRRRRTTTLMYSFRGEMAKTQATTG